MAGAKKINGMVGMTLLVVLIVASLLASPVTARDPFVGLSVRGRPWKRAGASTAAASRWQLECCDNCQCEDLDGGSSCSCYDRFELQDGCAAGCESCSCDPDNYPACACDDLLDFCPDPCSYENSSAAGTTSNSATTTVGAAADAGTRV